MQECIRQASGPGTGTGHANKRALSHYLRSTRESPLRGAEPIEFGMRCARGFGDNILLVETLAKEG